MPSLPDESEAGAVLMLNELVRRAIQRSASDIHLEPKHDRLQVRLRIDGAMVEEQSVSIEWSSQVVSRVKVLAKMDIAERRVPQDGQLSISLEGLRRVHLRASTFPCAQGEKVVLRLLFGGALIPFEQLGMDADVQVKVREIVRAPQGFLVTSGPTGSGKTSTLYSFLKLIDTARVNVMTLEDPVEVEIPQITQGQAHVKAGFTFATGLRAILRQDPDVILVGEMRDSETAQIALQASLTGHMVMSTLHTASAVDTVVRLVDLGIEPWIVANALSAVLAQRLVRNACTFCGEMKRIDVDVWDGTEILIARGTKVLRPRGCAKCNGSGYRGRTGIFEVLVLDDELRDLIKNKASAREYRELMVARKIPTLRRQAYARVQSGQSTVDELLRVT